jgi:hypothetical protein
MNPEPCPVVGLGFIPSKKSQNGIFWMVQWWVLGHSSRFIGYDLFFNLKNLQSFVQNRSNLVSTSRNNSHKNNGCHLGLTLG